MEDRILKFGGKLGEAGALLSMAIPSVDQISGWNMLYTCPRWYARKTAFGVSGLRWL